MAGMPLVLIGCDLFGLFMVGMIPESDGEMLCLPVRARGSPSMVLEKTSFTEICLLGRS